MELILIHLRTHRRQFGHLVTERFGIMAVEVVTTAPALRRLAHDEVAELFRRYQGTTTTVVTGAVPSSVGVFATRTSMLPVLLLK